MTYTVSIGRRIGTGDNLDTKTWAQFRGAVEGAIQDLDDHVLYFAGLGGGTYEGVFEESATWVFGTDAPLPRVFTGTLARLARRYGQESIAVTAGETSFITAHETTNA